jgi:hypothetical protein
VCHDGAPHSLGLCGMSVLERAGPCPERTLRTSSDEATGGSGFSSLCWPRNSWRAYSARWMSQLAYNGPSLFGTQNACVSAALTTQRMQRGRRSPSSGRCRRELGNVIRRR